MGEINLESALQALAAVLDVCAAIPGTAPRNTGVPWVFPEVGASGQLENGDAAGNTLAKLTWDIVSIVGVGNDEQRNEYDPDVEIEGDTYEPNPDDPDERLGGVVTSVTGNRAITVQVRCEVQASGAAGPFVYLERVRTRLGLPTVNDALEAAGLAIADITDARPADFRDDSGRTVRCAYIELLLNAADVAADDAVTTIETVEPDYSNIE